MNQTNYTGPISGVQAISWTKLKLPTAKQATWRNVVTALLASTLEFQTRSDADSLYVFQLYRVILRSFCGAHTLLRFDHCSTIITPEEAQITANILAFYLPHGFRMFFPVHCDTAIRFKACSSPFLDRHGGYIRTVPTVCVDDQGLLGSCNAQRTPQAFVTGGSIHDDISLTVFLFQQQPRLQGYCRDRGTSIQNQTSKMVLERVAMG